MPHLNIKALLALVEGAQVSCPKGVRAGELGQIVVWHKVVRVWGDAFSFAVYNIQES